VPASNAIDGLVAKQTAERNDYRGIDETCKETSVKSEKQADLR